MRSRIVGTGMHLPARVVTNKDLEGMMDTTDEWIRERTGIEKRHWLSGDETGIDLSVHASEQALAKAGFKAEDIDAIVFATSTPDHFVPGNGVFLQRRITKKTIPAIDIRTQCSGFVFALSVADGWIRSGAFKNVLVVGEEVQSTALDVSTRGRDTAVIFADGAGAAVLAPCQDEDRGILAFDLHGDGKHAEKLWCDAPGSSYNPRITIEHLNEGRHFLAMEGREVFKHAITKMGASVKTALSKVGLTAGDIDMVVPHQANLRISNMIQEQLGLPDEKIFNNIMYRGNTTAATIPIALHECLEQQKIKEGDLVALTAFGSGFLWGSAVIRW